MQNKILGISYLLVLIISFNAVLSCGSSREVTQEDMARLERLVQSQHFEIDLQWARPMATNSLNQLVNSGLFQPGDNASQINIQGFSSVFKFEGDTVIADLPYFGERQMGGGYNSNTGIKFKGIPEQLEITKQENKNFYRINFRISEKTESFQVMMQLYPNMKGFISINSSERTPIRYDGKLEAIATEE